MSTDLKPIAAKGFLSLFAAASLGFGCSGRLTAQNPQNIGKDKPDQAPVAVEKDQPPRESKVDKLVVPKTKLDDLSFQQLTVELNKMTERFGKIDYQNRSYSFDSKAALEAGYDQELVKLAEEMVDWQNQRGQDSKRGVSIFGNPDYTPSTEKHPRLIRLMQRMTENSKINKEKAVPGKKSPKASEPLEVLLLKAITICPILQDGLRLTGTLSHHNTLLITEHLDLVTRKLLIIWECKVRVTIQNFGLKEKQPVKQKMVTTTT